MYYYLYKKVEIEYADSHIYVRPFTTPAWELVESSYATSYQQAKQDAGTDVIVMSSMVNPMYAPGNSIPQRWAYADGVALAQAEERSEHAQQKFREALLLAAQEFGISLDPDNPQLPEGVDFAEFSACLKKHM